MTIKVPQVFRGSLTMSGVDTYTEVEIDTNLLVGGNQVALIRGLEIIVSQQPTASADSFQVQLCRSHQSAIGDLSDHDMLIAIQDQFFSASGAPANSSPLYSAWPRVPIPVIRNLFLGCDTDSYAAAMSLSYRVHYELAKATSTEVMRLMSEYGF